MDSGSKPNPGLADGKIDGAGTVGAPVPGATVVGGVAGGGLEDAGVDVQAPMAAAARATPATTARRDRVPPRTSRSLPSQTDRCIVRSHSGDRAHHTGELSAIMRRIVTTGATVLGAVALSASVALAGGGVSGVAKGHG